MLTANLHKLKTLIPLHELESGAQQQIYEALELDFLKTLAVMPDCHTGYTLPIGGVALLQGVISPEYVGYDIGCGMTCIILDREADWLTGREKGIFDEIYRRIPVGFNCHNRPRTALDFKSASGNKKLTDKVMAKLNVQTGTLGSGNHFIELGATHTGKLAIVIHSGSRNIGHSIASHYMELSAQVDNQRPAGFLSLYSDHGQAYLRDMEFAQDYALMNRQTMMVEVLDILGCSIPERRSYLEGMINENHNLATVFLDHTVLHRKGATPAYKDQLGVIPGNMRDGTYITKGLGNEEYLCSASHGAGRTMSRKQAKRQIDLADFQATMAAVMAKVDASTLDESPMAYKDLEEVITRQKGIVVDVIDHIQPLINIKG